MRPVPIITDEEADAVQHAINVHIDHYGDIGEDGHVETLTEALTHVDQEEEIPAEAVSLVWDILVEHDHLRVAMDHRYNDGEDAPYLLNVLTSIVAFNGDHLFESYQEFRERYEKASAE